MKLHVYNSSDLTRQLRRLKTKLKMVAFQQGACPSFTETLSTLYNSDEEGNLLLNKGKIHICLFYGKTFEALRSDAVL